MKIILRRPGAGKGEQDPLQGVPQYGTIVPFFEIILYLTCPKNSWHG
jgi:hypothetical protein